MLKPDYLPRAAAGGGPLAERGEERGVEGANPTRRTTHSRAIRPRLRLAPSTIRSSADGPPPAASRGR